MKNKKGEIERLIKILLWIILFAVLLAAVYLLYKKFTS